MIMLLVEQVKYNDTTGGGYSDNAIGGTGSVVMVLLFVVLVMILL